ncbi:MAG: hypothetical protein HOP12_12180 [Candidatus Eisenbacteria bacterium]|uniref:Exosortase system-associated protein, TIGR04073 family n=1 Tax=Eiseniibacteriota bacterium TaxID=2212470 RepID=A0A849SHQ2_UNCEI|nr:hypothetical protein [Candidatus Eisenbacteria bacterium]
MKSQRLGVLVGAGALALAFAANAMPADAAGSRLAMGGRTLAARTQSSGGAARTVASSAAVGTVLPVGLGKSIGSLPPWRFVHGIFYPYGFSPWGKR